MLLRNATLLILLLCTQASLAFNLTGKLSVLSGQNDYVNVW